MLPVGAVGRRYYWAFPYPSGQIDLVKRLDRYFAERKGGSGSIDVIVHVAERDGVELHDWVPDRGHLRSGGFGPFMPAIAGRWFSEEGREIIERWLDQSVRVQWLPMELASPDGSEVRPYWLLVFLTHFDGVDPRYSTRTPGGWARMVLDPASLQGRHVLPSPRRPSNAFLVSQQVRRELVAAGATKPSFRPAQISPDSPPPLEQG